MPGIMRYSKAPAKIIPEPSLQTKMEDGDKSQIDIKKQFVEDNHPLEAAGTPLDFSSIERNIENEILNSSSSDLSDNEEA